MRDFTFDIEDGITQERVIQDERRNISCLPPRLADFESIIGEFVRITGYLMRRKDYLKFASEGSRYHSDVFGAGAIRNRHLLSRPTRTLTSNPLQAKFQSFYHISLVDGPGSRSALFFQGCNLHCMI